MLKVNRQMEREDTRLGFTPKEKAMKRHGKKAGSWGVYNKALHAAQERTSMRYQGQLQDKLRHKD